MGASDLACGPRLQFVAQITLGGLQNRQLGLAINSGAPLVVSRLDHDDVVIGATLSARFTADTGVRIDGDNPRVRVARDGSRGTSNHANRISAVHARVGKQKWAILRAIAHEPRRTLMGRSAGFHTLVTASASVEIDQHGLLAINQTFVH